MGAELTIVPFERSGAAPADAGQFEKLRKEKKLAPIEVLPEAQLTQSPTRRSFAVSVVNRSPKPVDAYVERSLAYPMSSFLSWSLSGDGIEETERPNGPEVYDLMGRTDLEKLVIPPRSAVRFVRSLPLELYRIRGKPAAKLRRVLNVNGEQKEGEIQVTLRPPESLFLAAKGGDAAEVKRLLAKSPGQATARDELGRTPLHLAVEKGDKEVVRLLLEGGADVKARSQRGASALDQATQAAQADIVQLLLQHGAPIDAPGEDHLPPLVVAAARGYHTEIVKLLVARGAKLDVATPDGDTPLHCAARNERLDTMRVLLQAGADCRAKNAHGQTPSAVATAAARKVMQSFAGCAP